MRACFLGQNVCGLGYGVAVLQTRPAGQAEPGTPPAPGNPQPAWAGPNPMFAALGLAAPPYAPVPPKPAP